MELGRCSYHIYRFQRANKLITNVILVNYISPRKYKNCAKGDICAVLGIILTNNDKSLSRNPHFYEQVTHAKDRSKACQS